MTYLVTAKASHVLTERQPMTRVLACLFLVTAIFGMGRAHKAALGGGTDRDPAMARRHNARRNFA